MIVVRDFILKMVAATRRAIQNEKNDFKTTQQQKELIDFNI